ncbi:MAG: DnaJ C-terminal domain-containing protein [Rhizobiaceae bacterium]
MRDPYQVLGVAKSASDTEIKSAYRRLAKKYHPDQNPDDPKAKERFAEANQAYEIVGDKAQRGKFDAGEIDEAGKPKAQGFAGGDPFAGFRQPGGRQGGFEFRQSGGGFGAEDILKDIFGGAFGGGAQQRGRPQQQAVPDMAFDLAVTLEDAASHGKVEARMPDGRLLSVALPKGVEDGQQIRLKGQGHQTPAARGDAIATVRLRPHPDFRVDGKDLHIDLPVPLHQAILGVKLPVKTLSGKLAITIPPLSSSDKVLRLRGKGMMKKDGTHGDILVHVRLMLPSAPDGELEKWAKGRAGTV